MQYKLLNYYKMLANVAGNLVGAFVPLIIYEATQSLVYATLFLAGVCFFRIILNFILNKVIQRNPEIFLMMRFFTLGAYCLCLNFLSYDLVLFSILSALFLALDRNFKTLATETLLNYSAGAKVDSKKIGFTRVFEKLGIFTALIVGGILLDVNQTLVYIIAVVFYLFAIIPLFMYYIKNKKKETFNKELVSNAVVFLSKNEDKNKKLKYIGIMVLACYFLMYSLYGVADTTSNIFNLSMFASGEISYSFASMFVLTYNIAEFVGNIVIGKLEKKYDLLNIVRVSFFILSAVFLSLVFVKNITVIYICFAVFGFVYAFICAFVLQRLLQKSRILGVSNKAFVIRERAALVSYLFIYLVSLLIAVLDIPLTYTFCVTAVMFLVCGIIVPILEEKTRKMLVDYVEDNEIIVDSHNVIKEMNEETR